MQDAPGALARVCERALVALDIVSVERFGTFVPAPALAGATAEEPNFPSAGTALAALDAGDNSTPALVDLDGDVDLLVGSHAGGFSYFANTGIAKTPAFAAPVANPFGLSA